MHLYTIRGASKPPSLAGDMGVTSPGSNVVYDV